MPTVEITVQYINSPKPGKQRGSIKAAEGAYYWGSQATINAFQVGEVCTIEYDVSADGKWNTIKKKISGRAPSVPAQPLRGRTNPSDSEQIFVTALLKEFVAAGKIETSRTAVVAAGNALKGAYQELFGTPARQTTEAELDDKIPDAFR